MDRFNRQEVKHLAKRVYGELQDMLNATTVKGGFMNLQDKPLTWDENWACRIEAAEYCSSILTAICKKLYKVAETTDLEQAADRALPNFESILEDALWPTSRLLDDENKVVKKLDDAITGLIDKYDDALIHAGRRVDRVGLAGELTRLICSDFADELAKLGEFDCEAMVRPIGVETKEECDDLIEAMVAEAEAKEAEVEPVVVAECV